MAADILLYDAEYIYPLAKINSNIFEGLTRRIAEKIQQKYAKIFTLPAEPKNKIAFMNVDDGIRIRDLQNPEKK